MCASNSWRQRIRWKVERQYLGSAFGSSSYTFRRARFHRPSHRPGNNVRNLGAALRLVIGQKVGIAESDGSAGWTHQKNGPSAADVSRRRTVLARGGAAGFQAPPAERIRWGTA